jgi:hypothetical protein
MVTGYVPGDTEPPTLIVIVLVDVAGFVPNAAVIPVGIPDAARVTLPVNPLYGVTTVVKALLVPCGTFPPTGKHVTPKSGLVVTLVTAADCRFTAPVAPMLDQLTNR